MTDELLNILRDNSDAVQAEKMSAYMKNRFSFLGIPKPKLKDLIKPFLKATAKSPLDWDAVYTLWDTDFREAQYVALEYLEKHRKQLIPEDIDRLRRLIVTHSWWDTVDSIDALVGDLILRDESVKSAVLKWAEDENLWLRRTAIDCQQSFKEKTDTELLEKVIVLNLKSKEFFINKAIGWSLREYSKTDSGWVISFVDRHRDSMAPLSIKEALRLI